MVQEVLADLKIHEYWQCLCPGHYHVLPQMEKVLIPGLKKQSFFENGPYFTNMLFPISSSQFKLFFQMTYFRLGGYELDGLGVPYQDFAPSGVAVLV